MNKLSKFNYVGTRSLDNNEINESKELKAMVVKNGLNINWKLPKYSLDLRINFHNVEEILLAMKILTNLCNHERVVIHIERFIASFESLNITFKSSVNAFLKRIFLISIKFNILVQSHWLKENITTGQIWFEDFKKMNLLTCVFNGRIIQYNNLPCNYSHFTFRIPIVK